MKTKALCVLIALSMLWLLPGNALAADPYEINVVTPLTGSGAFIGKNESAALAILEKSVNQAGGVRGRQIKFAVQDDQSSPQLAIQLLNGLSAKHVPIVLGSTLAAICSAMLPLIDNGPVDYCFSSAIHPAKGSYMYSGNVSTTDLIAILVRYFRERGWKRIALLNTTDSSGEDGDRGVDAALRAPENRDVTVVDREHYNPTDLSVAAQVARIKASGAQAVIAYAAGTPFGTAIHGLADAGVDLPVGASSANLSYAAMKQFTNFLPRELYFVGPPGMAPDALPKGKLKDAVMTFRSATLAEGLHPDIGLIGGWDPGLIAIAGLKALGFNASAVQMKAFIDQLHDFPGAYGIYDFRDGSQRGLAAANGIVMRWDPASDYWRSVSKFGDRK